MKKYLVLILTLILSLTALIGCGQPVGGGNSSSNADDIYSTLQDRASARYDSITLDITTKKEGAALRSKFIFKTDSKGLRVDFTRQVYAKIEIIDGVIVLPENQIETVTGYAILNENGEIIESSEENGADSLEGTVGVGGKSPSLKLSFKENYFVNATYDDKSFSATVSQIPSFLDVRGYEASDMTVNAKFSGFSFTEITLDFSLFDGGKVSAVYTLVGADK